MSPQTPPPAGELDLTNEPPVSGGVAPPAEREYDPEPGREQVRAIIALGLTAVVGLLAISSFFLLAAGWLTENELERLQLFFTPLITLSGTALGFYFGGRLGS